MKHQLNKNWNVSKNKNLEIEFIWLKKLDTIFKFLILWTITGDHAGFSFHVVLFKLDFNIHFYDCRHWDYRNHKFIDYESLKGL